MKTANLTIPEVGLVAVTRAVLGIGIGLLIHDKLRAGQRAPVGWTCLAIGLLTTMPLAVEVFGDLRE